jgi:hypothetical protein
MGVGGQCHASADLPPGMTRYPFYRGLGGPQDRSGKVSNNSPPPGIDPRTVQSVASKCREYIWGKVQLHSFFVPCLATMLITPSPCSTP